MHLSLNAVACAMRTNNSGVQGRRARSARYAGGANVVCFDLVPTGEHKRSISSQAEGDP